MNKYIALFCVFLYTATYYPIIFKIRKIRQKLGQKNSRKLVSQKAKQWANKLMQIFNYDVEIIGYENIENCKGAYVVVANHESAFDIPIIISSCCNPAFIAKKELKRIPIVSSWMIEGECTFLDRSSARNALKVFADSAEIIKKGKSFVVFPEGTRSHEIKPFKKGSFRLPKMANAPILPVTIIGSHKIFGNRKLAKHLSVKCIISKPIYPPFDNNINKITRDIIIKTYNS